MKTTKGIKYVLKLKGDKENTPDMYLGESLEQVETKGGTKCWLRSSKKHVKAAVVNLYETLAKREM